MSEFEPMKNKSEKLADKMNKITARLTENLEIAEELDVQGDDIIEYVEEKQTVIETMDQNLAEVISVQLMTDDFSFVRGTLKDCIKNAKKVLDVLTLDLLDADEDKKAGLIMSLAELNKSITDSSKLYISSWKELSIVLSNLDKINKNGNAQPIGEVNNTVNVNSEPINTTDLIKKLKG